MEEPNIVQFVKAYQSDLASLIEKLDSNAVANAIECLRAARNGDHQVFICGNGGSASIASQMVVDIVKGASYQKSKRFRMTGLTDSIATITAYANDVSYECVFVEQLKNFATAGDVLIAVSGSGNSPNVLRAAEYANEIGGHTIGLTTGEGGRLKELAQLALTVPSGHMGRLEDCFFILTHILCYAFMEDVV